MKLALVVALGAGIPVCLFGILCVFYRLYCKRDRKKDVALLKEGRKLWRKSYEVDSTSPESLTIPKHTPSILPQLVQDSPQLSSTSGSTHTSVLDEPPCFTDDDNSSLSNYRTAPDYSPGSPSTEGSKTIELISLGSTTASPPQTSAGSRKIPAIRVMDENKDVLFQLEVDDTNIMQTEKVPRREDKIPVNLPSSVIQRNRTSSSTDLGKLSVALLYKQSTCELFLKVNKAFDLPAKDLRNNTSSPFIRLYVLPSRRHNYTTNIVPKCLHPVFDECFAIGGLTLMEILQLTIQFLVIHFEPIQRNVVIGELSLPLVNYEFVDEERTICQNIKAYKPHPVLGELLISVCHQPLANKLSLVIVQAKNLPKISNYGIGDPYIKVELFFNGRRICKKKTRSKKKTTNPRFMQTFTFDLDGSDVVLETVILVMTVLVKDPGGCHEKIGQVVLSSLTGGAASAQWNEVISNPHCPVERWQMIYE